MNTDTGIGIVMNTDTDTGIGIVMNTDTGIGIVMNTGPSFGTNNGIGFDISFGTSTIPFPISCTIQYQYQCHYQYY
jgi:hypothetical protein